MNIVVPDDYPPFYSVSGQAELDRLRAHGEVTVHDTRFADTIELGGRIAPAEVVINVRAYSRFDSAVLAAAPQLKLISVVGTGVDHVDVAECTRRGVVVCNTPGVATASVAELAIGLMLSVARMIPASDRALRGGEWRHRLCRAAVFHGPGAAAAQDGRSRQHGHYGRLKGRVRQRASKNPEKWLARRCTIQQRARLPISCRKSSLSVFLRNSRKGEFRSPPC